MAGRKGRGRAWAPLRAHTEQAAELAQFLRDLIDVHGVTLRQLQDAVMYGKSTISDNLSGKVPPKAFVDAVVRAVVTEPRKRALDLEKAYRLWEAADKPPSTTAAQAPAAPGGALAVIEKTNDRLAVMTDRALELEQERVGAHQLTLLLLRLVTRLQKELDALSAAPAVTQEQIDALTEQLRIAKQELELARQARQEAELLASRAHAHTTALEEELAQLRTAMPPTSINTAGSVHTTQLPEELQEEYFLADVDRALATAEGFLKDGVQRRGRLADDLTDADSTAHRSDLETWQDIAQLTGRALGGLLMMGGAMLDYALATRFGRTYTGFGTGLVLIGTVLLIDPWDLYFDYWPIVRAKLRREKDEYSWSINLNNVFSRLFRLAWGTASAIAAVLSVATLFWWSPWLLLATVPSALFLWLGTIRSDSTPLVEMMLLMTKQVARLFPGTPLAEAFQIEASPATASAPTSHR
ncbi:hypothetical protein [Streptomyces sp. NBC_00474]|uniref:hypothetical protein n=1 Tax=Streptomyces sp. NBC_00474 TaxID=2975754 RepID=UPI00224FA6C5|nr:hypothetical protein [Streptomyces sp. NBC_00474]MCX5055069.1 hypothetical protein [Streptomyces sp. NBC_00474]